MCKQRRWTVEPDRRLGPRRGNANLMLRTGSRCHRRCSLAGAAGRALLLACIHAALSSTHASPQPIVFAQGCGPTRRLSCPRAAPYRLLPSPPPPLPSPPSFPLPPANGWSRAGLKHSLAPRLCKYAQSSGLCNSLPWRPSPPCIGGCEWPIGDRGPASMQRVDLPAARCDHGGLHARHQRRRGLPGRRRGTPYSFAMLPLSLTPPAARALGIATACAFQMHTAPYIHHLAVLGLHSRLLTPRARGRSALPMGCSYAGRSSLWTITPMWPAWRSSPGGRARRCGFGLAYPQPLP